MTKDEALKLALEALETLHDENMDYLVRNKLGGENNQCLVFAREAITAIKEALAQPEQEPVAWRIRCTDPMRDWVLMYRHPKTEEQFSNMEIQPLYTTPPQRKPLTDEEIMNIAKVSCIGISPQEDTLNFAKVIEAVHGIKGEA